jgi:enoyl-CoA hydratase/carnithine racemase
VSRLQTISYDVADGVATITLNRPEKRNAIDAAMFQELGETADRAAGDPTVRVVLLQGERPTFCAGIDVATLMEVTAAGADAAPGFIELAQRPFRTLAAMPKPVIASVRGHALGAGFQLALACDLRLAATDATFGMLEVRFGLIPDLGGNRRLTELVGPAVAKEFIWTGRRIDSSEATRIGLVNRVVASDALSRQSEELAWTVATQPALPLAFVKDLVGRSPHTPPADLMRLEAQAQASCLASEDHREAVSAFLENRPPTFAGR